MSGLGWSLLMWERSAPYRSVLSRRPFGGEVSVGARDVINVAALDGRTHSCVDLLRLLEIDWTRSGRGRTSCVTIGSIISKRVAVATHAGARPHLRAGRLVTIEPIQDGTYADRGRSPAQGPRHRSPRSCRVNLTLPRRRGRININRPPDCSPSLPQMNGRVIRCRRYGLHRKGGLRRASSQRTAAIYVSPMRLSVVRPAVVPPGSRPAWSDENPTIRVCLPR